MHDTLQKQQNHVCAQSTPVQNSKGGRQAVQPKTTAPAVIDPQTGDYLKINVSFPEPASTTPSPSGAPVQQTLTDYNGIGCGNLSGAGEPLRHTVPRINPTYPVQMDGGGDVPADTIHQAARRGIRTYSTALPYGNEIQRAFGRHDISGIRYHSNPAAAQSAHAMNARAYTCGNHVVSAGPISKHTAAHEAAHYIQQLGGVRLKNSVGSVGDEYERHADAVGDAVVQGKSAQSLLDRYAGPSTLDSSASERAPQIAEQSLSSTSFSPKYSPAYSSVVQRLPVVNEFRGLGTSMFTAAPDRRRLLEKSKKYERRLGIYGFNHPKAKTAASKMMHKVRDAVIGKNTEGKEYREELVKAFGGSEAKYAGNVGKDYLAISGVLENGNLREKMTGIYNAMFGSLKAYIMQAFKAKAWAEMAERGFDVKKIKKRKGQLGPFSKARNFFGNWGAADLYRDPGNPLDRKEGFTPSAVKKRPSLFGWRLSNVSFLGGAVRDKRRGDITSKRTVESLENEGVGLSMREMQLMFPGTLTFPGAGYVNVKDKALKWEEGGNRWKPNLKNPWVRRIQKRLGMPVVAGPSGTMLRMFQIWDWLGGRQGVPAEDWRLAVMSWMLVENDHSFHEMMMTARQYGLPYTGGQMAYRNVDPLTVEELRTYVCERGMFPDELDYFEKFEENEFSMVDPKRFPIKKFSLTEHPVAEDVEKVKQEMMGDLGDKISLASIIAIYTYTDKAYIVMNKLRKNPNSISKWYALSRFESHAQLKTARARYNERGMGRGDAIRESMEHNSMLTQALAEIAPIQKFKDKGKKVYRGGGFIPVPWTPYKVGSVISFGKGFISASKNPKIATNFMFAADKKLSKVFFEITPTKSAVDITKASKFRFEEEVLFPINTKFKITKRKYKKVRVNGKTISFLKVYAEED